MLENIEALAGNEGDPNSRTFFNIGVRLLMMVL